MDRDRREEDMKRDRDSRNTSVSNNNNIPVVKGDSTPLVGSEISAGNRYWVYYNKCDNVIQVMNHYTVAAAPAA